MKIMDSIDISDSQPCRIRRNNTVVHTFDANAEYDEFFRECMVSNEPAIITVDTAWPCYKFWATDDHRVDVNYLDHKYGSAEVTVALCDEKIYNVQKKIDMCLSEYLFYLKNKTDDNRCMYLKDWHFTKDYPSDNVYRVPKYFASDWLNEYYGNHPELKDDYRFVYLGPKGSWTPLHSDVFTSYSWSVNVVGRKKWLLLRPGFESKFRDSLGNLEYKKDLQVESDYAITLVQEAGQAIFVPSSWHHQVWNLEDTLSINHNWINGTNISFMWESMKSNLSNVKLEIEDCKNMEDWDQHCHVMLKALYGFDYLQFYQFLCEIGQARIRALNDNCDLTLWGNWKEGKAHMLFDLQSVQSILRECREDDDMIMIREKYEESVPENVFDHITSFLENC